MDTGFIIKLLRTSKGLSQGALADTLGVTRSYLSQVENDKKKPSLSFLREVAKLFEMPLALFLAWDDPERAGTEILRQLRVLFADVLAAKISAHKADGRV